MGFILTHFGLFTQLLQVQLIELVASFGVESWGRGGIQALSLDASVGLSELSRCELWELGLEKFCDTSLVL